MIPKYRAWDSWRKRMSIVDRIYIDTKGVRLYDDFGEYWRDFSDVILMQSTGLKDKNGQEIFEGDILTDEGCELDEFLSYVYVIFKDGMWYCMPAKSEGYSGALNEFNEYYSAVGNIYETPELLEANNDRD